MKKVLIVGGNIGSLGLVELLTDDYPEYSVEVATISPTHPVCGMSGVTVKHYTSGLLADSVDIDQYDFLIPGSHDLYWRDLVASSGRPDLLRNYMGVGNKRQLHNRMACSAWAQYSITHADSSDCLTQYLETTESDNFVLKPVEGSGGGKGIYRVARSDFAGKKLSRIEQCLDNQDFILEEYVDGDDFALSLFLSSPGDYSYYIDREYIDNFKVIGSISSQCLIEWARPIAAALEKFVSNVISDRGFFHIQLRIKNIYDWKIIEVTQRFPGDVYWWPAENLKINYRRQYVESWAAQFGVEIPHEPDLLPTSCRQGLSAFGRCYSGFLLDFEKRHPGKLVVAEGWSSSLQPDQGYGIKGFYYDRRKGN